MKATDEGSMYTFIANLLRGRGVSDPYLKGRFSCRAECLPSQDGQEAVSLDSVKILEQIALRISVGEGYLRVTQARDIDAPPNGAFTSVDDVFQSVPLIEEVEIGGIEGGNEINFYFRFVDGVYHPEFVSSNLPTDCINKADELRIVSIRDKISNPLTIEEIRGGIQYALDSMMGEPEKVFPKGQETGVDVPTLNLYHEFANRLAGKGFLETDYMEKDGLVEAGEKFEIKSSLNGFGGLRASYSQARKTQKKPEEETFGNIDKYYSAFPFDECVQMEGIDGSGNSYSLDVWFDDGLFEGWDFEKEARFSDARITAFLDEIKGYAISIDKENNKSPTPQQSLALLDAIIDGLVEMKKAA
ncbi:hypothetical protein HYU14_04270 [Candidatus Woesearchaeota archaeon]|nr:hypothetical protein [Candidatus Woesearchaeota archaeon]